MSRDKQMINDLIEIFDEEYSKRYLITPQNTAEKMTEKGYRKASEVARQIFEEIDSCIFLYSTHGIFSNTKYAELKKKYIGEGTNVTTNTEET